MFGAMGELKVIVHTGTSKYHSVEPLMILKVCQHGQVERCTVHAFSADKITNGPGDSDMHPHIVETIVYGVQISLWRTKLNGMLFADWQA
ncbi:hypothetical protein A9O66_31845 (plasmid) [Paraburkholderia caribensis]|uniref:Uncharacterized protein n=1 Tax=Paraburkholderia caribensis TaxID=75105 RepID=A0A9Q6WQE9_9BURK|nr:hypothetical protein A9O66_31845 [Paraburkholderia caribensis]